MEFLEIKIENIEYLFGYKFYNPLKIYHAGKSWPKHTSCTIIKGKNNNGYMSSIEFIGNGIVIKHERDSHNPRLAKILATKKAMKYIKDRELRTKLWKELLNKI